MHLAPLLRPCAIPNRTETEVLGSLIASSILKGQLSVMPIFQDHLVTTTNHSSKLKDLDVVSAEAVMICGVTKHCTGLTGPNIGLSCMKKDRINVLRYENMYT